VPLRDDIVDGDRLDEISVTIRNAEKSFNSSLAWILSVEDDAEKEFEVKIWHTHNVDVYWREGWQYILKDGRYRQQRDGNVLIHSTDDFTVRRPENAVDLLAIGDSHIGRENRPEDGNYPYHTARQFVAAMGYAERYDVNAVIHAGDLFDDNPTPEDILLAESGFEILKQNEIQFYFIYGNHGVDEAKSLYERIDDGEISHLDTEGVRLNDSLEIFGVDYSPKKDFTTTASDFETSPEVSRRLLVIHNEVDPPREESGIPVETLSKHPEGQFDRILSGHLHDPESGTYTTMEIQYLGSTAEISVNQNASDQSAWLIRVTPDKVDVNQLELR